MVELTLGGVKVGEDSGRGNNINKEAEKNIWYSRGYNGFGMVEE